MKRIGLILMMLIIAAGAALAWRATAAADAQAGATLASYLSADETSDDYAKATVPGAISFPDDLGAHPEYQTEWWYYTGNLQGEDGREFGFQFTIFRRALAPEMPAGDSPWRTNQLYFAHFTISDIANEAFYDHERFSRGAAGLAGAQAIPYRVWLEDWYVEEIGPDQVRMYAEGDEVTLDLVLTQTLPPILHGDQGLSRKGAGEGNASYYYSFVQQRAEGTVTLPGETVAVTGKAWKDHEYSTSVLEGDAVGWDWFSLQLDDGASLMFFHIRNEDGTLGDFSSGTYVAPDGSTTPLKLGDWTLEVTDEWTSPRSGATYPVAWEIAIPALDIELEGGGLMPDQELDVSTVYWEGAVGFSGTRDGQPVSARGYVEMTGYAGSMEGRL